MSKGSKPRPLSISQTEFAKNFDKIFKKEDNEEWSAELLEDKKDVVIEFVRLEEDPLEKSILDR